MQKIISIAPDNDLVFIHIPAGEFIMGENKTVYVEGFWMSKYPITVKNFSAFTTETKYMTASEKSGFGEVSTGILESVSIKGANWRNPRGIYEFFSFQNRDNHPVTHVDHNGALKFCQWLSNKCSMKARLPSEEEWEKASRGVDGRAFPWGTHGIYIDILQEKCNCYFKEGDTTPVGAYSPEGDSPYGVSDMAGNVFEWTMTRMLQGSVDKKIPLYVFRGGSYASDFDPLLCWSSCGGVEYSTGSNLGFRICSTTL